MSKKKLIVIPLAGLGNRMRVLSSCIQIAKKHNRTLYVVWPINSDLGCNITDIFQSIGVDYSVPPKWIHYILTSIYRLGLIRRFHKPYKLFSKFFFDNCIFDRDIIDDTKEQVKQLKINSNDSTLLIASCLSFVDEVKLLNWKDYLKNENNREYFKLFDFTDYLKAEANREYEKIKEPYIGMHIRRTDHTDITKYSPNQNFLDQIDNYILQNSMQKFFLATDDKETKDYFTQKYGNCIYTLNIKLGRTNLEGIYGAAIELILLSKSNKIICSNISSYSTAAILLGDIKEVIYV